MTRLAAIAVGVASATIAGLAQQNTGGPTTTDLLAGLRHPERWVTFSGDYTGQRHSPLTEITPANAHQLAAQWTFQTGTMTRGRGFETTPLAWDGVLYVTGSNNFAWALDGRTGRPFWQYRRELPAKCVAADNAYMPVSIRNAIVPGAAAVYFDDPAQPDGVTITRDDFDLGINAEKDRRRTFRGVIGVNGKFSEHARYEASYVYGVTNIRFDLLNDRITRRWLAAIDAVTDPGSGQIVCRSTLNADPDPLLQGCIPYNVFGDGLRNPASAAWVNTTSSNRVRLAQRVVSGSIAGDLGGFARLPGGPIEYAVGAEYRKESSDYNPDSLISQGET